MDKLCDRDTLRRKMQKKNREMKIKMRNQV